MTLPNGTFLAINAIIGSIATILAANGIGNATLNGGIAVVLTSIVAQIAHHTEVTPKAGA